MTTTYKSRISVGLVLFIALVCFCPLLIVPLEKFATLATIVVFIFCLVIASFLSIKYVIDGQTLKVCYFYFIHLDIDIKTITRMEPNHNPLSSPAASLSRLAIYYGKHDMVNISPRNQEEFIRQINSIIEQK